MINIVISGSMKVKEDILKIGEFLSSNNFNVLLPVECIEGKPKSISSRAHFDRIIDKKNNILLVVNSRKNGIDNYIGPNSFAEISFGFQFNKEVYLLYDIYEPLKDELEGWNVKTLNGDIENFIKKYND